MAGAVTVPELQETLTLSVNHWMENYIIGDNFLSSVLVSLQTIDP